MENNVVRLPNRQLTSQQKTAALELVSRNYEKQCLSTNVRRGVTYKTVYQEVAEALSAYANRLVEGESVEEVADKLVKLSAFLRANAKR